MGFNIDDLGPLGFQKFEIAQKCLLPNENIEFVCQIERGFLVLTDRRAVLLRSEKEPSFNVEMVIPYDCLLGIDLGKEGRVSVSAIPLDIYGCKISQTKENDASYETKAFVIKAPKSEKGEDKKDVKKVFHLTIESASDIIDEMKKPIPSTYEFPPKRDYTYLDKMPDFLTRNAILDLNSVLQDKPIHNELQPEALMFLGANPFLLEESLKDGRDSENGILFAAGNEGYIWIQGKKKGRFLSNVLVDKIEWENIRCFANQWQITNSIIHASYSLQRGRTVKTIPYIWKPAPGEHDLEQSWLFQPQNGSWIFADLMYKFARTPMPASWIGVEHQKNRDLHIQRYYY